MRTKKNKVNNPAYSFRARFVAGLTIIIPLFFSIWLIWFIFRYIGGVFVPFLENIPGVPALPDVLIGIFSIVIVIFLIWLVGLLATNVVWKWLFGKLEKLFSQIPLVNRIFNATRRLTRSFFIEKESFREAVLVEYPRRGVWVIAFVTRRTKDKDFLYIPTAPNPLSGYFVMVSPEEIIPLEIGVDEAMGCIISGGSVTPEGFIAKISEKTKKEGEQV